MADCQIIGQMSKQCKEKYCVDGEVELPGMYIK